MQGNLFYGCGTALVTPFRGNRIDFDAMVASGVISQETRDAIKAYMDEHKPEGEMPTAPAEGEAPADDEPSLLNDLLNAGIITQTEYDALSVA